MSWDVGVKKQIKMGEKQNRLERWKAYEQQHKTE